MKQFGRIFRHRGLQFSEAVATQIGSVIGAGVLGIPYAVSQVGFLPGVVMLVVLAVFTVLLELMYVELTLRTKQDHEIPGYGSIYLGHGAGMFALLIGVLSGYGTLLAYLIAQGEVLQALFGGSMVFWSMVFFAGGSYIIYRGLNAIRTIELVMTIGMFLVLMVIGFHAHPHVNYAHLVLSDVNNFIVPYGVLIFALAGLTSIPQVRIEMMNEEKNLPFVIIVANIAIFIMYLAFMYLVLGVTGAETTEVATVGLGEKLGPAMVILGNTLAFFTITTSFITVGLSIRRLFHYDYGMGRFKAWLSTIIVPLVVFLIGARSFIAVLGVVGGTVVGVQSAIVVFAFWKAQKSGNRVPEFSLGRMRLIGILLLVMFALGAILTVIDTL